MYNVFRDKSEVLNKDSLDTFINATVTDDHPNDFVNTSNIKSLHKGSSASYEISNKDDIYYVEAKLIITDEVLIKKIKNGKVEISAGYDQKLVKEKGTFKGVKYDYKQTNIKINHIAIVDAGRCGDKCKITSDKKVIINTNKTKKGENMGKLNIDGVDYEICDAVDTHIQGLTKAKDGFEKKAKESIEELSEKEKEKEKLQAEKDLLEEENKKEKGKSNDTAIAKIIDEKVAMLSVAKDMKVEVKTSDSVIDMKKAIVSSKTSLNLDGKSEDYINASYDMLKEKEEEEEEKKKKIEESQKNTSKDFKSGGSQKTDDEVSKAIFDKKVKQFKNPNGGN